MKNWQRETVGIEIFSVGARFVRLSFQGGKMELADFGEKAVESGASSAERAAEGLKQQLSGARVKISFTGQNAQTCRLSLPPSLLAAGEDQFRWELRQKLPSRSSDYELFVHSANQSSFLGTALRKKPVGRTAAAFAEKGLDLSFTSAAFALLALFSASELAWEGAVGLVHLGEDFTTLVVLDEGEMSYVSEIPTPANLFSEPKGELAAARELLQKSLLERFGIELATLLHLLGFRASRSGRIETVYLCGPGSALGQLSAAIGQMGGVRVGHLSTHRVLFPAVEEAERFALALGLALSGLGERSDLLRRFEFLPA